MNITVYEITPRIKINVSIVESNGCIFYDIIDNETSEYIQCFKPINTNKIVVSSFDTINTTYFIELLNNFFTAPDYPIVKKYVSDYILIKTIHSYFKVQIKNNTFEYNIKVGSSFFQDCVEIIVFKTDDAHHKLAQIYSEPECWEDLVKGDTVEMIKGALQFVQTAFNVHSFVLDDNSNIECGISTSKKPPRKFAKPFPLSHLYLATKGETWYENRFGAKILYDDIYQEYKNLKKTLFNPAKISFEEFVKYAHIPTEQRLFLLSYYDSNKTWIEFFNAIPKSKHCSLNWLPFFIDNYILYDKTKAKEHERHLEIRKTPWVIYLAPGDKNDASMIRTDLRIITDPKAYISNKSIGGKRVLKTLRNSKWRIGNKTRKNKLVLLSFNNDAPSHNI